MERIEAPLAPEVGFCRYDEDGGYGFISLLDDDPDFQVKEFESGLIVEYNKEGDLIGIEVPNFIEIFERYRSPTTAFIIFFQSMMPESVQQRTREIIIINTAEEYD